MQTVIRNYENIHTIFNQIEWLYQFISDDKIEQPLFPHILDTSFIRLCDILAEKITDVDIRKSIAFAECSSSYPIEVPISGKNMIVCISGGKDSVALTKKLIDDGYNVHLYHMRGINKVYPDEYKAVVDVAHYFNIPYHIDTVALSGTQRFTEHPMKNMIIANGALHYGIREDIGTEIAFGNFKDSFLDENQFDVCAGDCTDMWWAYDDIIQTIIPQFRMNIPLYNNYESLEIIERNPELLPLTISCISPYRFREHWKKRTEKKYGIELLPNRCGCCWKCAVEYMYYTDHELLDFNLNYYLHCVQILCDTLRKESKVTGTIQQVWDEYMHYPIDKSKIWRELKNATIQNGKVKCITTTIE